MMASGMVLSWLVFPSMPDVDDKGKKMEGKKMAVRPATASSRFFCPRFFCLFVLVPAAMASCVPQRPLTPRPLSHGVERGEANSGLRFASSVKRSFFQNPQSAFQNQRRAVRMRASVITDEYFVPSNRVEWGSDPGCDLRANRAGFGETRRHFPAFRPVVLAL